jgi:hypothetical protein
MDLKGKIIGIIWGASKTDAETVAGEIMDVVCESVGSITAHWQSEIDYWKQRVEELEIDLMLERSAYDVNERHIKRKQRGVFK